MKINYRNSNILKEKKMWEIKVKYNIMYKV